MSTKRVILANSSRLLRELLHHVIDKADGLEVVREIPNREELPSAIADLEPEWVIVSSPHEEPTRGWLRACLEQYPSVRFVVLSPDNTRIKLTAQAVSEEDLTNLTLHEFIHLLERDLQHT